MLFSENDHTRGINGEILIPQLAVTYEIHLDRRPTFIQLGLQHQGVQDKDIYQKRFHEIRYNEATEPGTLQGSG